MCAASIGRSAPNVPARRGTRRSGEQERISRSSWKFSVAAPPARAGQARRPVLGRAGRADELFVLVRTECVGGVRGRVRTGFTAERLVLLTLLTLTETRCAVLLSGLRGPEVLGGTLIRARL